MLVAMLPIAYALALGHLGTINFDEHQELEILMTIGQSLLGAMLLANMKFAWWEAALLFVLWAAQFALSGFEKPLIATEGAAVHNSLAEWLAGGLSISVDFIELFARRGKEVITALYFAWTAGIIVSAIKRRSVFEVFTVFPKLMREHW